MYLFLSGIFVEPISVAMTAAITTLALIIKTAVPITGSISMINTTLCSGKCQQPRAESENGEHSADWTDISEIKFMTESADNFLEGSQRKLWCKIKCVDGEWVGPLCSPEGGTPIVCIAPVPASVPISNQYSNIKSKCCILYCISRKRYQTLPTTQVKLGTVIWFFDLFSWSSSQFPPKSVTLCFDLDLQNILFVSIEIIHHLSIFENCYVSFGCCVWHLFGIFWKSNISFAVYWTPADRFIFCFSFAEWNNA